jgi:hypothetical protein
MVMLVDCFFRTNATLGLLGLSNCRLGFWFRTMRLVLNPLDRSGCLLQMPLRVCNAFVTVLLRHASIL